MEDSTQPAPGGPRLSNQCGACWRHSHKKKEAGDRPPCEPGRVLRCRPTWEAGAPARGPGWHRAPGWLLVSGQAGPASAPCPPLSVPFFPRGQASPRGSCCRGRRRESLAPSWSKLRAAGRRGAPGPRDTCQVCHRKRRVGWGGGIVTQLCCPPAPRPALVMQPHKLQVTRGAEPAGLLHSSALGPFTGSAVSVPPPWGTVDRRAGESLKDPRPSLLCSRR